MNKTAVNWKSVRDSGGVWIALAVFLAVAMISNASFRSPQNLVNITRQVSYSGIIALGMTFVIAAGGIDLAVGSLFALAGVVSLFAMHVEKTVFVNDRGIEHIFTFPCAFRQRYHDRLVRYPCQLIIAHRMISLLL